MKKRNNKGFTLIELLAVIVILAVLVLVALPAVTSLMNKSRKGAFRTEALYFGQDAISTAYNALLMTGSTATNTTSGATSNVIYHLSGGGDYLCMTIKDLVEKGYSNKQNFASYGGYVQMFIDSDGTTPTALNITNGKFYLQVTVKNLAAITDVNAVPDSPSMLANPGSAAKVGEYNCPAVPANKDGLIAKDTTSINNTSSNATSNTSTNG